MEMKNIFIYYRMGILSIGRPLNWSEIVSVKSILKNHALKDLINIFNKHRQRTNDHFLWGDEVSYLFIYLYFY
jgi:glutamate--cysteine ligase catalytic subunit